MILHGVKSRSGGSTLFVVLCCLDPLLQYAILAHGLRSPLLDPLNVSSTAPDVSLGQLTKSLILLAMTLGSIIEQMKSCPHSAKFYSFVVQCSQGQTHTPKRAAEHLTVANFPYLL
jgi:hypothetical protein